MSLELTPIEEEVVFLKATLDAINSMVNFSILSLRGSDPDCSVVFETRTHQQFFNIGLVDFLSRTDWKAPVRQSSYLGALRAISGLPNFSVAGSVDDLRTATATFAAWLEAEITVDIWFPAVELQTSLRIPRMQYIKMTGDISKHNFLRSVGVAEDLRQLLSLQGIQIELDAAMLALDNFYEWFHKHVFNYHASTIAEFLNNIRWGIHTYLAPEFSRSIRFDPEAPSMYEFTYPLGVTSAFGKAVYWDLMKIVCSEPYVRRFEVTKWQKLRY
jgi:hypothetical protein